MVIVRSHFITAKEAKSAPKFTAKDAKVAKDAKKAKSAPKFYLESREGTRRFSFCF